MCFCRGLGASWVLEDSEELLKASRVHSWSLLLLLQLLLLLLLLLMMREAGGFSSVQV